MLLNTRAKWAMMILKLGIDDYLGAIIPMAQREFVPGRSMDAHLHEMHKIQQEGETGCWIAVDFRKAFDTVSHPMLEAFLQHAGLPKQWVSVIVSFLRGPIRLSVGQKAPTRVDQAKRRYMTRGHFVPSSLCAANSTTTLPHYTTLSRRAALGPGCLNYQI